jgi:hypothetical protein
MWVRNKSGSVNVNFRVVQKLLGAGGGGGPENAWNQTCQFYLNVDQMSKEKSDAYQIVFKNLSIIHEENTKKNHKRVVSLYEISLDLHKL